MDCDLARTCIEGTGVAVALLGGARALFEYRKKLAQVRFQMLMKVQETFHSSASFRRIREELDGQSNFDGMSKTERAEYATFFEDVALLRRGGIAQA
jgi:hypothetical protein